MCFQDLAKDTEGFLPPGEEPETREFAEPYVSGRNKDSPMKDLVPETAHKTRSELC